MTVIDALPSSCTSPFGCSISNVTGNLKGDAFTTINAVIPSPDFATTGIVFYSADSVFHTKKGDLIFKATGVVNFASDNLEISGLDTVIGGTGKWVGATGYPVRG